MEFSTRLKHAWNAFFNKNKDPTEESYNIVGRSSYDRPDRPRLKYGNEKSIVTSIYNRIAMDCAAIDIIHVKLDENGRYMERIDSGLNYCLTTEANIDQTGRAFIQDAVLSMLDEGHVALVPVDTDMDPLKTGSYDVKTLRVGKVIEWHPEYVKLKVYNDKIGEKQEIMLPKKVVAIIENPLYAIMNEPNSTLKRLIHKLALLDTSDDRTISDKLNMIIKFPFSIKTETQLKRAEDRVQQIEDQLINSRYGIGYIDQAENITQINRPLENNLMAQIEYLTNQLYAQLGLTQEILNGTATDTATLNYYNQTIEPILAALCNEMKRKFLTKTARTQGQSIKFFRDYFRIVPINSIAEIADKFTRNEIMTSNEIRQIIGMKPSDDPRADALMNSNLNQSPEALAQMGLTGAEASVDDTTNPEQMSEEEIKQQLEQINQNEADLDAIEKELGKL